MLGCGSCLFIKVTKFVQILPNWHLFKIFWRLIIRVLVTLKPFLACFYNAEYVTLYLLRQAGSPPVTSFNSRKSQLRVDHQPNVVQGFNQKILYDWVWNCQRLKNGLCDSQKVVGFRSFGGPTFAKSPSKKAKVHPPQEHRSVSQFYYRFFYWLFIQSKFNEHPG